MSFQAQRLSDSDASVENDAQPASYYGGSDQLEHLTDPAHNYYGSDKSDDVVKQPGHIFSMAGRSPTKRSAFHNSSGQSDASSGGEGFSPPYKRSHPEEQISSNNWSSQLYTAKRKTDYPGNTISMAGLPPTNILSPPHNIGHSDTSSGGEGFSPPYKKSRQGDQISSTSGASQTSTAPGYNKFASKMMAKMGYVEGEGLGKDHKGRVNIVEASKQRGRRGLGFTIAQLDAEDVEWDFTKDEIIIEEDVEWLPPCDEPVPDINTLREWKVIGEKKEEISDETQYCTEKTLKDVLKNKSVFDQLEPEEMRRARTRSNPYETIRGVFFLNRAAMKMANMDQVLDFMFTKPKTKDGKALVGKNELLYFADVCAGPGGFSEYVLWRTKGESKGFGMTLRKCNDFKMEDFLAGPSEMFEPHYGVDGADGDGDVFRLDNQEEFSKFVIKNTDNKGVHFMMADGGFSVEGKENIQEILSKQLYLCQFIVGLSIIRTGGNFVCKLFDLFTPFSVGLVYLMYRVFDEVSIYKPVTSRPANSERYIVCKGLKEDKADVLTYMKEINADLNKYSLVTSQKDVREIVPFDTIAGNEPFFNYIYLSNEKIARKQVRNLKKIQAFTQNTELYEKRQKETRDACLKKWQVPDKLRATSAKENPSKTFERLMKCSEDKVDLVYNNLSPKSIQDVHSVFDYRCMVSSDKKRLFVLGLGKGYTYQYEMSAENQKSRWRRIADSELKARIELPADTLLEAEICQEFRGEGRAQRKLVTVHVLDGYFLCGQDIQDLPFQERVDKLRLFVKAINKPTKPSLCPVKVPEVFKFEEISNIFNRLEMKQVKGSHGSQRLCFQSEDEIFSHPAGIHLIKFVKDPWLVAFSNSQNRKYFYNTMTRESLFHCPADSVASVRDCKQKSFYWAWESGVKVHESQQNEDVTKVSKDLVLQFVAKKR